MKIIYWLLTRFGWGYNLISAPLGLARDLGTFALFIAIILKVKLGIKEDVLIGFLTFSALVGVGEWLFRKGYLTYSTKLGNSVNGELLEILEWVRRQK